MIDYSIILLKKKISVIFAPLFEKHYHKLLSWHWICQTKFSFLMFYFFLLQAYKQQSNVGVWLKKGARIGAP